MTDYVPPLADIGFALRDAADLDAILATERFGHVDADTVFDVLAEVGRFTAEVVAPTNRDGDTIGSRWQTGGTVVAPPSFTSAYRRWVASGYGAMPFDPDFGGGGFPWVAAIAVQEMVTSANMAFSLCPLLTQGAIDAIHVHGSDELKATYLPQMLTGEWTGSMNLTEPQAGSDVGAVATRAVPADDVAPGAWRITGQKIFITWGEHDMADNIVHLVLARTPDSPPGTKGISMFLVPKFLLDPSGAPGERNTATCVSIEHKLGIHGSPTCVMSYDGAVGWLVGGEHDGMANMFTMMNNARLSVGLEGLSIVGACVPAVADLQPGAVAGPGAGCGAGHGESDHRAPRRAPDADDPAGMDRRDARARSTTTLSALDMATAARAAGDTDGAGAWQERADLLIPLSKSLCTDVGCELTSLALQIHGGMGYVEETGAAQHFRDARIAPIYEGTNGIQAADLVGRKLGMRSGRVVTDLLDEFARRAGQLAEVDGLERFGVRLGEAVEVTRTATAHLLARGRSGPAVVARRVRAVSADAGHHGVRRPARQVRPDGDHARRRLPPRQGRLGALLR